MTDTTSAQAAEDGLAEVDRDGLARSLGTDFFLVHEDLPAPDARVLTAVREFCDTRVAPVANDYEIEAVYT